MNWGACTICLVVLWLVAISQALVPFALVQTDSNNDAAARIRAAKITIYDNIERDSDLYLSRQQLETILNTGLLGTKLDYKIRTRAKIMRQIVCRALGYPVPSSFKKTQPRFPGQNLDCFAQKSNNLQIWNESIDPGRRYAVIKLDEHSIVKKVRVLTGLQLLKFDAKGTLTKKFQAKLKKKLNGSLLLSASDSFELNSARNSLPALLSIAEIFHRLNGLVGTKFENPGNDQERNRGEELHRLICNRLGGKYEEDGQFPDVGGQLLEVKLQTSPTVDLGLVIPDSKQAFDSMPGFRYCDTRYAIFYAETDSNTVELKHLVLVNGDDFFLHFQRFEGNVTNSKLQIRLPQSLFE